MMQTIQSNQAVEKPESGIPEKEVSHDTETTDIIGDLFEERDLMPSERSGSSSGNDKEETAVSTTKDSSPRDDIPSEEKKEKNEEEEDLDEPSSAVQKLKSDLEKSQKLMKETQRWGHQNSMKVKEASKSVKSLIENGALSEEEARGILSVLQSEGNDEEEMPLSASHHPFASLFQIANRELEHIRKYTDDEHLQDKIEAFDFLLSVSPQEEAEDILETLADLENDPVKLTRKMLSLGQEAYQDSYKAIKEAGGIKNYLAFQNNEIEKLNKKIDKLEKKLSQYEDYDKPNYRISGMSDINEKSSQQDPIGSLFEERDRPRQVAR